MNDWVNRTESLEHPSHDRWSPIDLIHVVK